MVEEVFDMCRNETIKEIDTILGNFRIIVWFYNTLVSKWQDQTLIEKMARNEDMKILKY